MGNQPPKHKNEHEFKPYKIGVCKINTTFSDTTMRHRVVENVKIGYLIYIYMYICIKYYTYTYI